MSKGGSSQVVGFRYSMSILFGLCIGPIDKLKAIQANKINIWPLGGEPGGTGDGLTNEAFTIAAANVFGGDDKEGGIAGNAILQMGADDQIADPVIKGTITGNVSDLRGWCTLFYDGLICSNNPYPKPWRFQAERALKGWYLDQCWYPNEAWVVNGMNPAHILVECLTNPVWGRGYTLAQLDEPSFRSAANTLCDENFGLNFMWARDVTLTAFMNIVVNHIGAALYTDRITGLVAIKLLRQDYEIAALPLFDYSTGLLEVQDDATTAPDSSHNELVVNYIDPIDGEKRQIRIQNLAGIQASNNIASTSVDYLGAYSAELAGRIGQRDMSIQAAGIRKFSLKFDRRARKLQPGGVCRISAPDRGLAETVIRVASVEQGTINDQTLVVKCIQDVFALEATSYVVTQPTTWIPPDQSPIPATIRKMEEITYRDAFRALHGDMSGVLLEESMPVIVAKKPQATSTSYMLVSRTSDLDPWIDRTSFPFAPNATLRTGIGYYDTVDIALNNLDNLQGVRMNTIAWLGEEKVEILSFLLGNTPPLMTIRRGCVDTVPALHGPGTRIWFPEDALGGDGIQYVVGDTVIYGLETRTSQGLSAPTHDAMMLADRQGRPYPQGALTINGTPFGLALDQPATGDLVFDGTERNRVTQMDHIIAHEDADVAQEAGTTYDYRFYDGSSASPIPLREETGSLTDPGFTYTAAMYAADGSPPLLRVTTNALRDGLPSFQLYDFLINRSGVTLGHGFNHGNNHGAPP